MRNNEPSSDYEKFMIDSIPNRFLDVWKILSENEKNDLLNISRRYNLLLVEQAEFFWAIQESYIRDNIKYIRRLKIKKLEL